MSLVTKSNFIMFVVKHNIERLNKWQTKDVASVLVSFDHNPAMLWSLIFSPKVVRMGYSELKTFEFNNDLLQP